MARPFSRRRHYGDLNPSAGRVAMTASGSRVRRGDDDAIRRVAQPWQKRAFTYYDLVPEINYAAQFYARPLSVLRLYVGEKQDDGTVEETENEDVMAQLDRMQDPGGGREGLLSTYGQLRFLTGECYLTCTKDVELDREVWEILSTEELKPQGKTYLRLRAPSDQPETYKQPEDDDWEVMDEGTMIVYRLWKRHPKFSQVADSTMRGVLDVCEELVLLTQAVRSRARSRLAGSGILLINGRYLAVPADAEPDENGIADPFVRDLMDAMTAGIVDEGSASAVVPHVVRVDLPPGETLDMVMKHLQIIDPMQVYPETGLRMELVKRLSIGLDMPPEVLTGISDTNHWNAWQVDEQTWKYHLQPVASAMVNDFTTAWFQPTLRSESFADWDKYVIAYDATAVINHPDRGKDATDAYDRRAIGKQALRQAKGFTDDDAPTEQELWEMIGIATRDAALAIFGTPSIRGGTIETAPGELVDKAGTQTPAEGAAPEPPDTEGPATAEKTAPEPTSGTVVGSAGREESLARILGASFVAVYRSRDLAGSKLRSYAKRNPDAAKILEGVPGHKVAATLGPELARSIGAPPARQLVSDASAIFAETIRLWGVSANVAVALGDRLEQFAAGTLFDENVPPLPASYETYIASILNGRNGR